MARKSGLVDEEAKAADRLDDALRAWHADRLEWADRAMRLVLLVNSGAAVALAAFIGTTVNKRGPWDDPSTPGYLIGSLACFVFAILVVVGYNVYRFLWAEYRIWYVRRKRRDLWDDTKTVDVKRLKTQLPPTRPQLWLTYLLNAFGLALFIVGMAIGFIALNKLV